MPNVRRFCSGWTLMCLLFASLALVPRPLRAQQDEIPPATATPSVEGDRIVTHRPRLYSVKRLAHPVSWLEGGMSPLLNLAEHFGGDVAKNEEKKPPESG